MSVLVVDASVVIKWFIPEAQSDAAGRLLHGSDQFVAPDLLFSELGNVIWKKVRRGELTAVAGRALAGDISGIAVTAVPMRDLVADAETLAIATGVTAHDAMYVTLALRLDSVLVTADARLGRALARHADVASHVQLLTALTS